MEGKEGGEGSETAEEKEELTEGKVAVGMEESSDRTRRRHTASKRVAPCNF